MSRDPRAAEEPRSRHPRESVDPHGVRGEGDGVRSDDGGQLMTLTELEAWGEAFGRATLPPAVVAIAGDLGAGKTTLVQAMCRGYGVYAAATSPTFGLVHEYDSARGTVCHLDLYRLRHPDELTNIGWDDILGAQALVLIEWPDRAGARLPAGAIHVELAHVPNDESRRRLVADAP